MPCIKLFYREIHIFCIKSLRHLLYIHGMTILCVYNFKIMILLKLNVGSYFTFISYHDYIYLYHILFI